jgi:hypothetical protein
LPSASFAASVAPIKCVASSGVPPTVGSKAYPITMRREWLLNYC